MSVELLRLKLSYCLEKISKVLPSNYKLTLVARHIGPLDADIIVTEDNPLKVADSCTRLHAVAFDQAAAEQLKKGDARFMAAISEQCQRLLPDGFVFVVLAVPFGSDVRAMRYIANCERDDSVRLLKGFLNEVEENPDGWAKQVS